MYDKKASYRKTDRTSIGTVVSGLCVIVDILFICRIYDTVLFTKIFYCFFVQYRLGYFQLAWVFTLLTFISFYSIPFLNFCCFPIQGRINH